MTAISSFIVCSLISVGCVCTPQPTKSSIRLDYKHPNPDLPGMKGEISPQRPHIGALVVLQGEAAVACAPIDFIFYDKLGRGVPVGSSQTDFRGRFFFEFRLEQIFTLPNSRLSVEVVRGQHYWVQAIVDRGRQIGSFKLQVD